KVEWTAYTASFFSVAILPMANLVVPLWALAIGASPFEIGAIMGARALLPFILAIHAGAMIDRIGSRRVMIFSALISAALAPLYPLMPWVGALIALQVAMGLITTMGWIGAQTHIAQLTRGEPVYMGRFTSISTLSNFIGPLIAGIAWDRLGVWGAFGVMALWSLTMWVSVLVLPDARTPPRREVTRRGARVLLPDIADYLAALRLALVPAIAVVVACSFLLNAALSVRFAFYVVYLESIDMTGTTIGFLVGVSSLVGAFSALATGPATRVVPQHWLALMMILISVVAVAVTPLAADFTSLFLLACLFGIGNGLGFAQIISLLSRIVPVSQLGMSIGLRTTANRMSSLFIPVLMGAIVEGWDLATSFYVVGALLAVIVALVALLVALFPGAAPAGDKN
ncbi:MAG: MFS transporter, partial [Alphaproteobacteria bacterium]